MAVKDGHATKSKSNLFPTFSRCTDSGAENSLPPHQNTMAVKDGHATKSKSNLLPTFSRCNESGAENSLPPHQNTMAVKDGQTLWQWSTDKPRNRTQKLSNIPSEAVFKKNLAQPLPVHESGENSPPPHQNTLAGKDGQTTKSHQKTLQRPFWNPIKSSLFPTFSRCTESDAENSPPPHQNTMAVKDGHATKSHQKTSLMSLLKPNKK